MSFSRNRLSGESLESEVRMNLPENGLVVVVKKDCETCQMVAPLVGHLSGQGLIETVISQDDPDFPDGVDVIHDRALGHSWELGIDIVPTLVKRRGNHEVQRSTGWDRQEWRNITDIPDLGKNLPEQRPGCGSLSAAPGMAEELQTRFGETGLHSRTIAVDYPQDEAERMFDLGWTDGLPVVTPTQPRVLRMLQGTTRSPEEVVGEIPPAFRPCSVEKAAINAVMAGCKPEYFPVVLAALDAALDPAFAWSGLLSTTMGVGPVIVVNGPITKRIGMNWGINVLGHGNRPNATIGRALQLTARNVGGAVPGGVDRSTLGHPGKFGVCFAENETDSAWESLATSRGVEPGKSAVTVFAGCGASVFLDELSNTPESLARSLASGLQSVGHPKLVQYCAAMLVIGHEHWQVFKAVGWSRSDIDSAIYEASKLPGRRLVRGANGVKAGMKHTFADGEHAKFNPGDLLTVRAGGKAGLMSVIVPGWGSGPTGSQPITREVTA